ncbi:MAG: sigma-70 family RNA polymerase sigma factor, partial [Phycisphaerales bacterium]|nr:sigma-70 family RNA polymerase sigma factor [Phycisphaerales bacterium]
MPNDWDLLRTFAREKDQRGGDAFSELVTRHVDMVYGVARRMLGTAQADDAVQAVFLLLSQRADRISANGSLAGWLFRTTMYCCGNIKKSEDRRRRHERSSTMKQNEHVATNEELTAVLDEALERLGEKQRQAILVRYLENKSVAQTSEALGVSVSVVERRLRHGLEKIREVFARHGFVVPTVAVGAVMMAESAKAAPAGLVASAVGVTTQASASVVGIAKGALTMMKLAAVKTIAAVVAVVVFIVIAAASVSLLPKDQGVPEVVTEVKGKAVEEKQAMNHGFTRHKLFEYRFDVVEFPESLKVAGVPKYHGGHDDFVGEYYRKFKPLMKNRYEPYTEICVWSSLLGEQRANSWESGDRIFGCLVMSLDDLPEGIVGADIRVKKFLVMTVRGDSWEKCGAVGYPTDLFKELMPKEYKDALYPPIQEVNWHFQIGRDDVFFMSYIESEREIKTNPDAVICERKYYAPLLATTEKANKVPGIRDYMVGMKGHNYRLPDCLSFIWERLGDHP